MDVQIEWLGHTGFKITGSKVIYIDPYKLEKKEEPADIVLLTNSRYYSCSPMDIQRITGPKTKVFAPKDCAHKLTIPHDSVGIGETKHVGAIRINTLPAYTVNKPEHQRVMNWVGYLIEMDGVKLFHAGYSDFTQELTEIRADIVMLPIDRLRSMDPEEASEAAKVMEAKLAIPMAYDEDSLYLADEFEELCEVPIKRFD